MRYSLIIWQNRNSIREIKGYSLIPGYKCNERSLHGIDRFCEHFNNEEELKTFLLEAGLIKESEWNNRLAIGLFKKGFSWPIKTHFDITYKHDIPFFHQNNLQNYYLNNIMDISFMGKFMRTFQFPRDINYRLLNLYYTLKATGTLDDYSKESLTTIMKDFLHNFIYDPQNTRDGKINYLHVRMLAKMASRHAAEKGTICIEDTEEYVKTPITDEALRSELYQRYQDLEDNPTKEESEAILSRVKEIEDYFNAVKELSANAVRQRRLAKKERPELYN